MNKWLVFFDEQGNPIEVKTLSGNFIELNDSTVLCLMANRNMFTLPTVFKPMSYFRNCVDIQAAVFAIEGTESDIMEAYKECLEATLVKA